MDYKTAKKIIDDRTYKFDGNFYKTGDTTKLYFGSNDYSAKMPNISNSNKDVDTYFSFENIGLRNMDQSLFVIAKRVVDKEEFEKNRLDPETIKADIKMADYLIKLIEDQINNTTDKTEKAALTLQLNNLKDNKTLLEYELMKYDPSYKDFSPKEFNPSDYGLTDSQMANILYRTSFDKGIEEYISYRRGIFTDNYIQKYGNPYASESSPVTDLNRLNQVFGEGNYEKSKIDGYYYVYMPGSATPVKVTEEFITYYLKYKVEIEKLNKLKDVSELSIISRLEGYAAYLGRDIPHSEGDTYDTWVYTVAAYATEDELKMYSYLVENRGKDEAVKYMNALLPTLNQRRGFDEATTYLKDIGYTTKEENGEIVFVCSDPEGAKAFLGGVGEGATNFFEGIDKMVSADATLTYEDYKNSYILDFLKENDPKMYDTLNISQGVGYMLPYMALSLYSGGLASAALWASSYGNKKDSLLKEGYNYSDAIWSSALTATSNVILEKAIGGVPGLQFLKNINNPLVSRAFKTFIGSAIAEGGEEIIQTWAEMAIDSWILDKDVSLNDFTEQTKESFINGMIISAILESPGTAVNVVNSFTCANGTINIRYADIQNYIETNNLEYNNENIGKAIKDLYGINISDITAIGPPVSNDTQVENETVTPNNNNNNTNTSTDPNEVTYYDSGFKRVNDLDGEGIVIKNDKTTNEIDPELGVYDELNISDDMRTVFIEQRTRFDNLKNTVINNKQITVDADGNVVFPAGTLYHGTYFDFSNIESIADQGILTGQAFGKSEDGETYYCADFYKIPETMSIGDYKKSEKEGIFQFNKMDNRTPFNTQANAKNNIAFVIQPSSELSSLLAYDAYNYSTQQGVTTREFVNENGLPLSSKVGAAILYGVPSEAISGIVVGENVALDGEKIKFLKDKFPNCYIATPDGKLIYNPGVTLDTVKIDSAEIDSTISELVDKSTNLSSVETMNLLKNVSIDSLYNYLVSEKLINANDLSLESTKNLFVGKDGKPYVDLNYNGEVIRVYHEDAIKMTLFEVVKNGNAGGKSAIQLFDEYGFTVGVDPAPKSLTTLQSRVWYLVNESNIENSYNQYMKEHPNATKEELARFCSSERNRIRRVAREAMSDDFMATYLKTSENNEDFNEFFEKKREKMANKNTNVTNDEVYDSIINSSMKKSRDVLNNILGLGGEI